MYSVKEAAQQSGITERHLRQLLNSGEAQGKKLGHAWVVLSLEYKMYSVKEAAEKMGITERHLRLLLQNGEVKGKKLGHDWLVLSLDYQRKRKPKAQKIDQISNN
jgi:excisionase family DNA binding protein